MRRILKPALGVVCLIVGVAALVTPFTPGAWLGLVGAELLGISKFLPKRIRDPWEKMKVKIPLIGKHLKHEKK